MVTPTGEPYEDASMFSTATRVLRLRFVPPSTRLEEHEAGQLIDFVAYAHESVLSGVLRLDADRLTDLLNGADEVELLDVVCLGLDGGIAEAERVIVPRAELVAVKAGDPRGRPSLRRPTRQVAIVAGAGRFVMHGYAHGRPGADPMLHISRRPPMVPLTDATIAYEGPDGSRRDDASTLIVNRDSADWIRLAREDERMRLGRAWGAA